LEESFIFANKESARDRTRDLDDPGFSFHESTFEIYVCVAARIVFIPEVNEW